MLSATTTTLLSLLCVAVAFAPVTSASYLNRVGFHLGPGGNHNNVKTYLQTLDAKGIPFVIKDVDEYSVVQEAAALKAKSGVGHVIVWRSTQTDVPPYTLAPGDAATQHWAKVMSVLPKGFDKDNIWLEVINEPDQTKSEWLAQFGLAVANMSMAQGFKLAMFGWSTGTPYVGAGGGPMAWNQTYMMQYLQLAAAHPDKLAIALHEYANTLNILNEYPYLLGRFHFLYNVTRTAGLPDPTVLITEWGWTACKVNLPATDGITDINTIMRTATFPYADYPVLGAFMWYLGPWSCDISDSADQLVLPVLNYTVSTYQP